MEGGCQNMGNQKVCLTLRNKDTKMVWIGPSNPSGKGESTVNSHYTHVAVSTTTILGVSRSVVHSFQFDMSGYVYVGNT